MNQNNISIDFVIWSQKFHTMADTRVFPIKHLHCKVSYLERRRHVERQLAKLKRDDIENVTKKELLDECLYFLL